MINSKSINFDTLKQIINYKHGFLYDFHAQIGYHMN